MVSTAWFWAASGGASLCALMGVAVLAAGVYRNIPEVGLLGGSLLTLSVLSLAGGLSGTSLAEDPIASVWAGLLALPMAVIAVSPVFVPDARLSRAISMRWKPWVGAFLVSAISVGLWAFQSNSSPPVLARLVFVVIGAAGSALLAYRQVWLYRIGRHPSAAVACGAITLLAIAWFCGLLIQPGGTSAWVVLVLENAALLIAGGAFLIGYRTGRSVEQVLAPIFASEPFATLEVGLSPEINAFVHALECKDSITRDHVVRCSELALRITLDAGMTPGEARSIAIGSLMHDVGKLMVPSDVLTKPAALTDEEFDTIKTHPEQGERLISGSPSLAASAPFVRGHHERVDGRGYPDGLSGDQISFEVGLVSVIDAWDAMTNSRHYREGMGGQKAASILREGAGTQWRADAVEAILANVACAGEAQESIAAEIVDHTEGLGLPEMCLCEDAVDLSSGLNA